MYISLISKGNLKKLQIASNRNSKFPDRFTISAPLPKLSSSEPWIEAQSTYKFNSTLGRSFVYLTQLLAKMGKFNIESINQIMVLANQSQMDNVSTTKKLLICTLLHPVFNSCTCKNKFFIPYINGISNFDLSTVQQFAL